MSPSPRQYSSRANTPFKCRALFVTQQLVFLPLLAFNAYVFKMRTWKPCRVWTCQSNPRAPSKSAHQCIAFLLFLPIGVLAARFKSNNAFSLSHVVDGRRSTTWENVSGCTRTFSVVLSTVACITAHWKENYMRNEPASPAASTCNRRQCAEIAKASWAQSCPNIKYKYSRQCSQQCGEVCLHIMRSEKHFTLKR